MTSLLILTIITGIAIVSALEISDAYAIDAITKYDGVLGESEVRNGWSDVVSVDWGFSNQPQDKKSGLPVYTISIQQDVSLPTLMEKGFMEFEFPQTSVEYFRMLECGQYVSYLRHDFVNVQIQSINESYEENTANIELTNTYEAVRITYKQYDDSEGNCGTIENTVQNHICFTDFCPFN